MIVRLDQNKRPPFELGDKNAPEDSSEMDEPWQTYYNGGPWDVYYDFNEHELYIVLAISGNSFRLSGGSVNCKPFEYNFPPYSYPKNIFHIVDETIPENWEILGGADPINIQESVRKLGIYTYSDLIAYKENNFIYSIAAYPKEFGIYGFPDLCYGKKDTINKMRPYLNHIYEQQTILNQKTEENK